TDIHSFILAMLSNPEAMKTAQEEIDGGIKIGFLPAFEDEESLPSLSAVVKETLRRSVVTPLAIPNSVIEDDIYQGYKIPAGFIVLPNVW
ncbi:cytochrome P450, partial [Mycena maculata]